MIRDFSVDGIEVEHAASEELDVLRSSLDDETWDILLKISRLDRLELLGVLSAMQLRPENLSRTVRLEYLAHLACLRGFNGTESSSAQALETICNTSVSPTITMQEDVCSHPLTLAFPFIGGCYTVFTGISPDQAFVLRQLSRALFLRTGVNTLSQFASKIYSTLQAVLLLSDELARRFSLERYVQAGYSRDVVVPLQNELTRLRDRSVFSADDLNYLFRVKDVSTASLDPLVTAFSSLGPADIGGDNGKLLHRPIVRKNQEYVVAIPGMLIPALRHWIMSEAVAQGISESLGQAFHQAVCSQVRETLMLFTNPRVYPPIAAPDLLPCQSEIFYSLDSDKALHILINTDCLSGYDEREVFGSINTRDAEMLLARRVQQLRRFKRTTRKLKGLLTVIVSQGVGRNTEHVPIESCIASNHYVLRISAEELELIALLDGDNQLALWQFAKTRAISLKDTSVLVSDAISEYGLYRASGCSFYVTDKANPDSLHIARDYGDALRQEVADQYDIHSVPAYWGNFFVDVALLRRTRNIPIYFPFRSLPPVPSFVVEQYACPIWVASSRMFEECGNASADIAESVAYWLWQLRPSIAPLLNPYMVGKRMILIYLRLDACQAEQPNDQSCAGLGYESKRVSDNDALDEILSITIAAEFIRELRSESNESERRLCYTVVKGLAEPRAENESHLEESTIHAAIDRHLPLGRKKHLLVVEARTGSGLDPTDLPPLRKVQDVERSAIADRLGKHITEKFGLSSGPIAAGRRKDILKACVAYCFGEIERLVSELSPRCGLLDRLVLQHEACVHGRRHFDLHRVPREECYSEATDIANEQIEQEKLLSHVGPALRFMVEYVTARPPRGRSGISLSTIDELIALGSMVIDYGMECDYLHHKLIDINYSILPSGRLGGSRDAFLNMRTTYFQRCFASSARRARERFAQYWNDKIRDTTDMVDNARFDKACQAEYGFAISSAATFLLAASEIAFEHGAGVATVPLHRFSMLLKNRLRFTKNELIFFLDLFSLRPRVDFLSPPSPFNRVEVYPWVYGRELSYLVRPLLHRRVSGRQEVVLGPRYLGESIEYIYTHYLGKRQNPCSLELRSFLGVKQEAMSNDFVEAVQAYFEGVGFVAKKNVEKEIPGFRNMGDIDVLVIDTSSKNILLVECKDLVVGRTPAELRSEVDRLFVDRPQKRSEITKHLRRLTWFKTNISTILSHFKLDSKSNWEVFALVVASEQLFGPFLRRSPLLVLSFDELRHLVISSFWQDLRTLSNDCSIPHA